MNMIQWAQQLRTAAKKKSMPILSYPGTQLIGASVEEVSDNSELQAKMMKAVADRTPMLAAVGLMDLSVEAECFGAKIVKSRDDIPTIREPFVKDISMVDELSVPKIGSGRSGIFLEGVRKLKEQVKDRPVFAGCVGPFSLAGRLTDVSEAMILCFEDPDKMKTLLEKCTVFLKEYAASYKEIGADGIVIAEPLAGVLSPDLAEEFSEPYVREIVQAVQDENFIVIYHNCGNSVNRMIPSVLRTGCMAYHFGNAVQMSDVLAQISADTLVMGNIDPVSKFKDGTPESMRKAVLELMEENCAKYPNFVISSGCDIPALSRWENIEAYFAAIEEFYSR